MNTLSEPADPKSLATAYALGELSDIERTTFEKQMAEDPALATLVQDTKDFCAVLDKNLALPTLELQQAAKARVLFEAGKPQRDSVIIRHKWVKRLSLAAACLAIGGTATWWWAAEQQSNYEFRTELETAVHAPKAATIDEQIQKQQAEVDKTRLAMNDLQKRHNSVDAVPLNPGGQSTVMQPSMSAADQARRYQNELETELIRMESQLKSLQGLKGEQLASGAMELGLSSTPSPPPPLEGKESDFAAPPIVSASAPAMSGPANVASGYGGGRGRGTGVGAGIGDGWGPGSGPGGRPAPGQPARTSRTELAIVGGALREGDFDRYRDEGRSTATTPFQPPITPGTESYKAVAENPFLRVLDARLSTFSIDVDTASYSNVRRYLNMNQAPPPAAVRLEELVNYFPYDYAPPVDGKPFAVHVEMTSAPWNEHHRLARIALKGKEIHPAERPAANLVFLVDVSGSMQPENKLPLVKQSLKFVVERLTEKDTVSLVTYAGESGVALAATNGADKARIMGAIEGLGAGGSTNGAGGITTAYEQAALRFNKEGINRVILATDGDFNVGVTSHEELQRLIEEKRKSGVFLSVLGYGMGNNKDDTMELLANKGNGNYAYIDSLSEARKSLADQFSGTLVTIAKDVKIQVEFNPAVIRSYRLLGYENRMLAKEDFNNDLKDAGEIGAGHTVTALYELVPVGAPEPQVVVDDLKYAPKPATAEPAPPAAAVPAEFSGETMTVKLRWKAPDADVSTPMDVAVKDDGKKIAEASPETKWAVAVAGFAAMLNGSQFNGLTWDGIRALAKAGKGADPNGYRGEFLQLIDRAESVVRR